MATAGRLVWRTSTYTGNGQSCVEVAPGPRAVLVRDTKDGGTGPILLFDDAGWARFCDAALAGRTGPVSGVTITRRAERTSHCGAESVTTWHVTGSGRALHFTESEWTAFGAGVRDGEFAFAHA